MKAPVAHVKAIRRWHVHHVPFLCEFAYPVLDDTFGWLSGKGFTEKEIRAILAGHGLDAGEAVRLLKAGKRLVLRANLVVIV